MISGNTVDSPELPPAGSADGGGIGMGSGNLIVVDTTVTAIAPCAAARYFSFSAGPTPVATTLIERSTISGNSAYLGGGIYDDGSPSRTLTVTNSTISGNSAVPPPGSGFDGAAGGGLFLSKPSTLLNATIAGNSAEIGGGVYIEPSGTGGPGGNQGSATIGHTIIAGAAIGGGTCAGAIANITVNGPNLSSDGACNLGGIVAAPARRTRHRQRRSDRRALAARRQPGPSCGQQHALPRRRPARLPRRSATATSAQSNRPRARRRISP